MTRVCSFMVLASIFMTALSAGAESGSMRPHMFVTAEPVDGLRSVADVRRDIQSGHAAELWRELVAKVEEELTQPAWTPAMDLPFRPKSQVRQQNREYHLVAMVSNRIMDAALVALITGERRYAEASLRQIESLYDPEQWPDWQDKAHLAVGYKADLRHGQLAPAIALAYDWMYTLLDDSERARIVDGLDRCGIQRFKAGVENNDKWTSRHTNWLTCIVGGFGIAGMALADAHPDAQWLVDYSLPKMEAYLSVIGPEGEFNESVQYAGSILYVVRYFMAQRYHSRGEAQPFQQHSLDDFCRWYMHMTFPPGRVAGFGDPSPAMPPAAAPISAVAAATQDPVLQWFYLTYVGAMHNTHRERSLELLYYDGALEAKSPEGRLPLGRAYYAQAKLISSRSSWDPLSAVSVVYAKAGRESTHSHADWGQLCIDGYADRLIVDLGSTPVYPKDSNDRYYNYQQWGHNVFVFGENETGGVPWGERKRQGEITYAEFDDARGAMWSMDLTSVYDGAQRVTRTVVHLLPRVAVVLDKARLDAAQPISMRWHTDGAPDVSDRGAFMVINEHARLACQVQRVDGNAAFALGSHEYVAPYNTGRLGEPFGKRREPFVNVQINDSACRLLSLFCVQKPDDPPAPWKQVEAGWTIDTPEGEVAVAISAEGLSVRNTGRGNGWLAPPGELK